MTRPGRAGSGAVTGVGGGRSAAGSCFGAGLSGAGGSGATGGRSAITGVGAGTEVLDDFDVVAEEVVAEEPT